MKTLVTALLTAAILPASAAPDGNKRARQGKAAPAPQAACGKGVHAELSALAESVGKLRKTLAGRNFDLKGLAAKLAATEKALAESRASAIRATAENAEARAKLEKLNEKYEMARRVATKALASSATKAKTDTVALARCRAENAAMRKGCTQALAAITGLRQQIEKLNKDISAKPSKPSPPKKAK